MAMVLANWGPLYIYIYILYIHLSTRGVTQFLSPDSQMAKPVASPPSSVAWRRSTPGLAGPCWYRPGLGGARKDSEKYRG